MEEKAATTAKSRITRRRRRSTFTGWQLQLTGSSQCYWSLQPPAAVVVEVRVEPAVVGAVVVVVVGVVLVGTLGRAHRKYWPSLPQPCAAPCVPWLSTVVLCVPSTVNMYILRAALCVVCCVVVHFALCAFDSSRLLCVHFHRRLFLTNQTQSKGMKDRQLHRYEFEKALQRKL